MWSTNVGCFRGDVRLLVPAYPRWPISIVEMVPLFFYIVETDNNPLPVAGASLIMEKPAFFLSVIIPVYNGQEHLGACLDALQKSQYAHYETIVVDDGSTDRSAEIAAQYPVKVLRLDENRGAGAARNQAVAHSRGKWLFFLDADILVETNTLSALIACVERHPHLDAFFCSYQAETPVNSFFSRYKNYQHHYTHQTSQAEAVTFAAGYGAIKKEVFVRMRGFDPHLRWLEDIDLGYRLHAAGYRIRLEKDIVFTHLKRYTLMGLLRSDIRHRAIPWTQLMLKYRIGRSDLNTKYQNIFSVCCAWFLFCYPMAALVRLWSGTVWLVGAAALLLANHGFLRLLLRQAGWIFTLKSVLMLWFNYFYSGAGLFLGLVHYRRRKK